MTQKKIMMLFTPTHSVLPRNKAISESRSMRNRLSHPYHPFHHPEQRSSNTWFEQTESQIRALVDSQNKMMTMFERFSDRITKMEERINSVNSTSTSAEEKTRVPSQLSVCLNLMSANYLRDCILYL